MLSLLVLFLFVPNLECSYSVCFMTRTSQRALAHVLQTTRQWVLSGLGRRDGPWLCLGQSSGGYSVQQEGTVGRWPRGAWAVCWVSSPEGTVFP